MKQCANGRFVSRDPMNDCNFEECEVDMIDQIEALIEIEDGKEEEEIESMVCPMDMKQCANGQFVSRDPMNDCNFEECEVDDLVQSEAQIVKEEEAEDSTFELVEVPTDTDEEDVVSDSEQQQQQETKSVQTIEDEATTYSGETIKINVLFNDFIMNTDTKGWGMPDFTSQLILSSIVTNGGHGLCSVTDEDNIIYIPNDNEYSGYDACEYKACIKDEETGEEVSSSCNIGSVLISIEPSYVGDDDVYAEEELQPWEIERPELLSKTDTSLRDNDDEEEEETDDFDVNLEQLQSINMGEGEEQVSLINENEFTNKCGVNETLLSFEIQTDLHGGDIKWEVTKNDDSIITEGGPYSQYSFDQVDVCVQSSSNLTFFISDEWKVRVSIVL